MHDYLLSAISSLCILLAGLHAEECSQGVLAKRNTLYVLEGGSLTLSCMILHCGQNWTGNWIWKNPTDATFSVVEVSDRHHLMKEEVSAIETRLVLKLVRISPLDEGSYKCKLVWGQGNVDTGHVTDLNVTAVTHRWFGVLVCAPALVCFPLLLVLAYCQHPSTQLTHVAVYCAKVPSNSSLKAFPKLQEKTEVVYTAISKEGLRRVAALQATASNSRT